jgi:hypothetical protein
MHTTPEWRTTGKWYDDHEEWRARGSVLLASARGRCAGPVGPQSERVAPWVS